jgi:hypothetical protein
MLTGAIFIPQNLHKLLNDETQTSVIYFFERFGVRPYADFRIFSC